MKTARDPRHIARIKKMKTLFTYAFQKNEKPPAKPISTIIKHISLIDKIVAKSAPAFPVEKIAKVDLAILRLALYELIKERKVPPKVTIDEAVELAKEFGGDTSSSFVNGVLGTVVTRYKLWKNK